MTPTYPFGFHEPNGRSVSGAPLWHLAVLQGDLDLATADAVTASLIAFAASTPGGAGIVADLTAVTFCDSTGMSALDAARDHLRSTGRDLLLRNPSPTVVALTVLLYGDRNRLELPGDRKDCRSAC